jgi:hypothetical protein
VHTSSSAWAFELQQLEDEIRTKLGKLAPARLRFAPGPLPEAPPPTAEDVAANAPAPTAEDARRAAELAAPIDDENLRKLVARAAAASLAKHAE